jgi:6-pyruvoyltetrahydropterin/6-carboxytetrahydropterin synthase
MNSPELELTHRIEFSSAHRLHDPALTDEENAALYGPCNNLNGHGHTYVLQVTVRGTVPRSGMIIDLNVLRVIMHEQVFKEVDHKHLDLDVEFMRGRISTAENLALACWERLDPPITEKGGGRLVRVRIYEGPDSFVDCFGT